jgi:hypothetical protein
MRITSIRAIVALLGLLSALPARGQQINLQTQVKGLLPPANGGMGSDTSSVTGCPKVTSGIWSFNIANCSNGGSPPAGGNFAIQYANGAALGGANFTGFVFNNGSSQPPTQATQSQVRTLVGFPISASVLATDASGNPIAISNVPFLNFSNSWSGSNNFNNNVLVQNPTPATSGSNNNCNPLSTSAQYWNGSVTNGDQWTIQCVLGTGANPTSTLVISHTGSSGAAGVSLPAASITGTNSGGLSTISGVSVNGVVNPDSYGVPSKLNATTTTGSITGGTSSLAVASATSFVVNNGIFINHAGAACGTTRGTACPTGPSPVITQGGAAGGTSYSYRASCIDGLGGVGVAGSTVTTTTGNASLSATNFNILTFTGVAGCIEIVVYRNGALIGELYAPLSGSYTFNDVGKTALASHRDIPVAPSASALNDNYVGLITAINGNTLTLNVAAGASVTNALILHSDTPLVQAAISASGLISGYTSYQINYPISAINKGGFYTLTLFCDTGDLCFDATGQNFLTLPPELLPKLRLLGYFVRATQLIRSRST